jgi:hypothetical protein
MLLRDSEGGEDDDNTASMYDCRVEVSLSLILDDVLVDEVCVSLSLSW